MKTIKKLVLVVALVMVTQLVYSQSDNLLTELPKGTKEAFVKSEPQIVNTINWLDNTPVDQNVDKRKQQMALLIGWVTDSPTVKIKVDFSVLPFTKKNPELLMTFIGGWTKYCLENSYSTDNIKCNLAGIKSVIAFYKKGSGLTKDKKMENLIELDSKNELESWVTKQLNKK